MTFRGYFALNGVEIANSSRVVSHLQPPLVTLDSAAFGGGGSDCALTPLSGHSGLYEVPPGSTEIDGHAGLYTLPDGAKRYDGNLYVIDEACWGPGTPCASCRQQVSYDDSWPDLRGFLGDTTYRLELAPWYSTRIPESAEFAGVWVLDVKGLDALSISRPITEMVGSGGSAGPYRDTSRTVTFDALLLACTNAGLTFGLNWLADQLRTTKDSTDSVLRYLTAHPSYSGADPAGLVREAHSVVLTKNVVIAEAHNPGSTPNRQATMYRVTFELTALSPYAWYPQIPVSVDWDGIDLQPITWVHAADCETERDCDDMPVLFSDTCVPEDLGVDTVTIPPPVCGGCLPVCEVDTYTFTVPTMDWALRGRETAATVVITNTGDTTLTLQGYWAKCTADTGCTNTFFPVQVSGLPPGAELTLDGTTGRFWAQYAGFQSRVIGIVGTPNGAPWLPPIIDRHECWQFVVIAPGDADFDVTMSLADRDA